MSWPEAWYRLRDRWLANAGFQQWATRFALTRPIARHHARQTFDLCAGFIYSQIVLACVQLRLLELLREGPQPAAQLASRCGLSEAAMQRLLCAAATLDLCRARGRAKSGDCFGLGFQGALLLGNPALIAMIEHHALLYADLADPVALLRGEGQPTRLQAFWSYAGAAPGSTPDNDRARQYSRLMSSTQALVGAAVLDACDMSRHHRLLDIGGGDGTFLLAATQRAPRLEGVLFDLPAVCELAATRFQRSAAVGRLTVHPGDFRCDSLPGGADIVSLVRVLHDHDDTAVLDLLRSVRAAIAPSGRLLIAEPLRATQGAQRMGDAYFGFYLLAMGQGRPRSIEEIATLLEAGGFGRPRELSSALPLQTRVLVASPSSVNKH